MAEIVIDIIEQDDIRNAINRGYRIEHITDGKMTLSNLTRAEVFAEELENERGAQEWPAVAVERR